MTKFDKWITNESPNSTEDLWDRWLEKDLDYQLDDIVRWIGIDKILYVLSEIFMDEITQNLEKENDNS